MNLKPIIIETQRLKLTGYSSQDMTFIFENFGRDEIKKILFSVSATRHSAFYAAEKKS